MKRTPTASLAANAERAAETAIEALAWLAADQARLERFLSLSGLGPQNLRKAAAEPRFLSAILGYLAANEALLVEFAGHSGRTPEDVARAHAVLAEPEPGDYR
jgi:hypothetical protein